MPTPPAPAPRPAGLLIVLEGIDGTGKSTQAELLAGHLRGLGREVVVSREPTDGPHGIRLRQSATTGRLSPEEELDLFHHDRRHHVEILIRPALEAGRIVILDRYYFSTMAYQGSRGLDPEALRRTNESFAPPPDLLLVLDLPVEAALDRIGRRDGRANQFEQQENLRRCQDIFRALRDPFVRFIDATQPVPAVQAAIRSEVEPLL